VKISSKTARSIPFTFTGYSIWLDPHGPNASLGIKALSDKLGLELIPSPHVTLLYGVHYVNDQDAIERFREVCRVVTEKGGCPPFKPVGVVCDVEFAGVDGGTMDMQWSEVTLKARPEHNEMFKTANEIFGRADALVEYKPHLSLGYDNPVGTPLDMQTTLSVVQEHPKLVTEDTCMKGLSLWDTNGKMSEWRRVASFDLRLTERNESPPPQS